MEGSNVISNSGCFEAGISSDGKPPNPLAGGYRHSLSSARAAAAAALAPCTKKSLIRHPSLVSFPIFEAFTIPNSKAPIFLM